MTQYIGIDPGASGALIVLNSFGEIACHKDFSSNPEDYIAVLDFLKGFKDAYHYKVAIESVHALPQQSTVAGFTFGKNVGMAQLVATGVSTEPVQFVTPMKWKKFFNLSGKDKTKTDFKHMSVDLARQCWPKYEAFFLYSKDGRAEAALIALWYYLTSNNQSLEDWLEATQSCEAHVKDKKGGD